MNVIDGFASAGHAGTSIISILIHQACFSTLPAACLRLGRAYSGMKSCAQTALVLSCRYDRSSRAFAMPSAYVQ
jgi:hypothetical protein